MAVGREGGRKWFAHGYGSRSVISWQTRVDSATLCTVHGARAFLLIHETEAPWWAVFKLVWRRSAFLGSDGGARRLVIDGYTRIRIEFWGGCVARSFGDRTLSRHFVSFFTIVVGKILPTLTEDLPIFLEQWYLKTITSQYICSWKGMHCY